MKKTKAELLSELTPEDLAVYGGADSDIGALVSILKTLMYGITRRASSLDSAGLYSHALENYRDIGKPNIEKILKISDARRKRNRLIYEIVRAQNFFNSKSSSIRGVEQINKMQDIRIFGKDKYGRPLGKLNSTQRKKYWDLYNEYKSQHTGDFYSLKSEQIQQLLGEYYTKKGSGEDFVQTLNDFNETMVGPKYIEENIGSVPNVFSGTRDDFK